MDQSKPTVHVEIRLASGSKTTTQESAYIRAAVVSFIRHNYAFVQIGSKLTGHRHLIDVDCVEAITVSGYTGPPEDTGFFNADDVQIDAQVYTLRAEHEPDPRRRFIDHLDGDEDTQQARVLALPNAALKDEWDSLIYDDHLSMRLLRYLCRMLGVMKQPGLNLSTFNWNRLCLLHGPPGSGKSTLCRALAQKLSIRLGADFPQAVLVEVNTNAMLSKYFGESGKLISCLFDKIHRLAQPATMLVCVVIDEVETIAGSREKASSSGECADGIRATNQLLTALDRLRLLPNIVVLCTSNLFSAIDSALLDRVDIKQMIPSPSPSAIYNIFRSCLNELMRARLFDGEANDEPSRSHVDPNNPDPSSVSGNVNKVSRPQTASSSDQDQWSTISAAKIPTFADMLISHADRDPPSPARRIWTLAQRCEGLSGRTLRRLPILGLAMHTWSNKCSLSDVVSALEAAVEQELITQALMIESK